MAVETQRRPILRTRLVDGVFLPRPDLSQGISRPIEVDDEPAVIEASRLTLASRGLLTSDQVLVPLHPSKRKHPNSQETYLVEQRVGDHMVLVSILKDGEKTSRHSHPRRDERNPQDKPDVYEDYVIVQGNITLTLGNQETILGEGGFVKVLSRVPHQVRANGTAILALVMENGGKYPPEEREIPE